MFIISILLVSSLAVNLLNAQSLNEPNCGQRPFFSRAKQVNGSAKIIGGVKSKVGDWSWSVSKF
jgi:hypothetical protein